MGSLDAHGRDVPATGLSGSAPRIPIGPFSPEVLPAGHAVHGGASPRYLATSTGEGHLVYVSGTTMFAVPFDPNTLETRGTAVPVLDDVAANATIGTGQFDVSRTGTRGSIPLRRRNRCSPSPPLHLPEPVTGRHAGRAGGGCRRRFGPVGLRPGIRARTLDGAARRAGRPVESRNARAVSHEPLTRLTPVVLARRAMDRVSIERIGNG